MVRTQVCSASLPPNAGVVARSSGAQTDEVTDPLRPPRVEQVPAQIGQAVDGRGPAEKSMATGVSPPDRAKTRRLPVAISLLILCIFALPAYFFIPIVFDSVEQYSLRTEGIPADAVVISATETNTRVNHQPLVSVQLRVHPEGAAPYETSVSQTFSNFELAALRPGATVRVKYNRDDPRSVVVLKPENRPLPNLPARSPSASDPRRVGSAEGTQPQKDAPMIEDTLSAVPRICRDASACCQTLTANDEADSCRAFLSPHIPETACATALSSLKSAAAATGKRCLAAP